MACIYIAHGANGIVKIGRTKNVARRMHGLKKDFFKFGDSLTNFFHSTETDHAYGAEYRLIQKVGAILKPYSGREWFIGDQEQFSNGLFRDLVSMAEVVIEDVRHLPKPREIDVDAYKRGRAKAIAEREAQRKETEVWRAKRKIQVADRKALRATRLAEIAIRAAINAGVALTIHTPEFAHLSTAKAA